MAASRQEPLRSAPDPISQLPWQNTGRTATRGIFVVAIVTAIPVLIGLSYLLFR
jgi:hypothetical protein